MTITHQPTKWATTVLLLFTSVAINAQQPTNWVTGQAHVVPPDAIVAGHEANGVALYVCRGGQKEGYNLQLGKYRLDWPGCDISYGGREINVPDFQVLVSGWQDGPVYPPSNAVQGGTDGQTLYYCRADGPYDEYGPGYQLGETDLSYPGCVIPGGVYPISNYQVLVALTPPMPLTTVAAQNGYIPPDAIQGGTMWDGSPEYLCSAEYTDPNGNVSVHPGRLWPNSKGCLITYQYDAANQFYLSEIATNYNVLVPAWNNVSILTSGGSFNFDFPAGSDIDDSPLYICRCYFEGGVQPGKVKQGWNACSFGWGGKEQWGANYDLLSTVTLRIR